jgi:NADPH:quinone reductase-like Zn-dependent oxidoreductase
MPREVIADRAAHAIFRDYDDPPLRGAQIRASSLFSAVKHGTEFRGFQDNSLDASERFHRELRIHMRGEKLQEQFPMALGNMGVAEVTDLGPEVERVKVGNWIFGHFPLRDTHTVDEAKVHIAPDRVSWQSLMYWDPADFAVGGIRDGGVKLGDRVAVFGLGAIGQMAVQCARLAGARWVAAVDLYEKRRTAALGYGADVVLNPKEVDVGLEIKRATDKLGVDVAVETSGSSHAFYDALRSVCYQGTVVSTAYYSGPMSGLFLSGEWHRNRAHIVSSRACSQPLPEFGWDFQRIRSESLTLLRDGRLKAEGLIDPIVPFAQAADAYMDVNVHPETSIKLGVDHTL